MPSREVYEIVSQNVSNSGPYIFSWEKIQNLWIKKSRNTKDPPFSCQEVASDILNTS